MISETTEAAETPPFDRTLNTIKQQMEVRLYSPRVTWGTLFPYLMRTEAKILIMTYSLPRLGFIRSKLDKRPEGIGIICHTNFRAQAMELKAEFPDIRIAVHETMHSKVVMSPPRTVYLGSANFGNSGMHETLVGLRSGSAYRWALDQFKSAVRCAEEIILPDEVAAAIRARQQADEFLRWARGHRAEAGWNVVNRALLLTKAEMCEREAARLMKDAALAPRRVRATVTDDEADVEIVLD